MNDQKDQEHKGYNRTGAEFAALKSHSSVLEAEKYHPTQAGNARNLIHLRQTYIAEAEPLGTVATPTSIRGLYVSGGQKFKGKELEIFIDKLGERLAFERAGARLYEALIGKFEMRVRQAAFFSIDTLKAFHEDELNHLELVRQSIQKLGADPTAITPSADVGSTLSQGLFQVVTDPRTSLAQSVQALLIAELTDHDGWELLIKLSQELDFKELSFQFKNSFLEEKNHLDQIRDLYEQLVIREIRLKN